MPTTDIEGPHSHTSIGTDIGDGVNYASISSTQLNRVLETSTGANAMAATATPSGVKFFNFFNDNQIPAGSTIQGIEIVAGTDFDGSGDSRISSFGSSTGTFEVECYVHNNKEYSERLTFSSAPINNVGGSGGTLSDSDRTATFDGSNKHYLNNSAGDDVLFGGTSELFGKDWDVSDQASWGFAITFQAESNSMVAGILRGFGMRVTYVEPTRIEKINAIISGSIERINTVAGNLIEKVNGIFFTGATPPSPINITYQFEDQTTQESSNAIWSPSGDASDWVNGVSAVTDAEAGNAGTNWGKTATKQVKGWNLGQDGTTSGNTGPNGGVNTADGTHDTSSDGDRYIYCETSTGTGGVGSSLTATNRTFVTRMPGFNFSTAMANTSTDLNLKFWLHAFGAAIGDLFIYIDTNTASNHSTATLIQSYTSFSGFTANSSNWQEQTVSLNSYRTVDATHYIYFVYEGATTFTGDLAVDAVQIIEA